MKYTGRIWDYFSIMAGQFVILTLITIITMCTGQSVNTWAMQKPICGRVKGI